MNSKKAKFILSAIIVIMCLVIGIVIYVYKSNSEILAAKKFLKELNENNMITIEENIDKIKYHSVKKTDGINVKAYYKINANNYDIEVDTDDNVIGFKNREAKSINEKISINNAKYVAEKYVKTILNEDVFFKEAPVLDESVPYYTFIFTKYLNGYPFYSDEIIINIDKSKGSLDGYSNYSIQRSPKDVCINISREEAKKIAIDQFNSTNSIDNSYVQDETFKAYAVNKDKTESELCYIVTVIAKNADENEIKNKYFISTESGQIINNSKDTITTTSY